MLTRVNMSSAAEQVGAQQPAIPITAGNITPQALIQAYGLTEEQAIALSQALPTLCAAVQQPIPAQQFQTEGDQQQVLSEEELADLRTFIQGITEEMTEFPNLIETVTGLQRTATQPPAQTQIPAGLTPEQLALLFQQQQGQPRQQIPQQNSAPIQFPWQNNSTDEGWPRIRAVRDENGTKFQMLDSIGMDIVKNTIAIDENGILSADAVMTAAMVQDYSGKKVLKCPEELPKACDAWKAPMPATNTHPPEGIVMNQDEIVGWTTPPKWDDQSKSVTCSVEINDAETIKAIQEGKTDVSIGFFCDLDETPGNYNGTDYDAVQRNIVFNHLAVGLDKGRGRCPNGKCGIQTDQEIASGTEPPCECCAHYDEMCEFITADARLTAAQRKALPAETFCGPERSFPVPDCAHYTAALRLLGRYQGPGNKDTIKACIESRGQTLNCPTAEDQEALHTQLIKEQTEALTKMCQTVAKTTDPEKFETLFDGIRELIWKLKDNLRIANAMALASVDKAVRTAAAIAIGDAAILQHQITTGTPTRTEKAGKYQLLPGLPNTHSHTVTLDTNGSGTSTVTDEHSHKVVNMNVQLADKHTHVLSPLASQEETPMSDKEKTKPESEGDEVEPPKVDTPPADPPTEEPKPEGLTDEEATPPADAPPEKDEASTYVDELIKAEHTKLVDSIMDHEPPKEREHYEGKSLDELRELVELLSGQRESDGIPATGSPPSEGKVAVDDAYAKVEEKLRTK
jgi:hypothetical protein